MEFRLKDAIDSAGKILIGIGKEWQYPFNDDKELMITKCQEQGQEWLIPFVEYYYLQHGINHKREEALSKLRQMVEGKDYFLVSTSYDEAPVNCGFSEERCVFPCGNYSLLQEYHTGNIRMDILNPLFPILMGQVEEVVQGKREPNNVSKIVLDQDYLVFNQKRTDLSDIKYNEEPYLEQWEKYTDWLQETLNRDILILELGEGNTFPTVIRQPFERIAYYNRKAYMLRVHHELSQISEDIQDKAIGIPMYSYEYVEQEFNK